MSLLPAKGDLDGSTAGLTTGGFQAAIGGLRDFAGELLGPGSSNLQASKLMAQQTLGIGGRNKIHNGNFVTNQRGMSSGVTLAPGAYGHDRWRAGPSGCQYTTAQNGVDIDINILSGALVQLIDGSSIDTSVLCISWEGSSRLNLGGGNYGTSPQVLTGLTPGATIGLEFSGGFLARVQAERAYEPTPFERRSVSADLALCQRYYQQCPVAANAIVGVGQAANTSQAYVPIQLQVSMRAVPTFANLATAYRLGGESVSALTLVSATPSNLLVSCSWSATPFVAGDAVALLQGASPTAPVWYASAEL